MGRWVIKGDMKGCFVTSYAMQSKHKRSVVVIVVIVIVVDDVVVVIVVVIVATGRRGVEWRMRNDK